MAPTRELAAQIGRELSWLFAPVHVGVTVVTGGASYPKELAALRKGPLVVVGTPGRLIDHMDRKSIDPSALGVVVLDEADQMLDLGFRDELEAILDKTPPGRRTLLLSATFPREVQRLADRCQKDPVVAAGAGAGERNEDIHHVAHLVLPEERDRALINILLMAPGERALVFVRTREGASDLADTLSNRGLPARAIHGDMEQRDRTRTLDAFRSGAVTTLVATDVAARGLDVPDVFRVIHADPPNDAEVFTHRSGRTGRAGKKGTSIVFVPPGLRERARSMLRRAGVEATWLPAPSSADVLRAADERLAAELAAPQAAGAGPAPRLRALAEQLLAAMDPLDLGDRAPRPQRPRRPLSPGRGDGRPPARPRGSRPSHRAPAARSRPRSRRRPRPRRSGRRVRRRGARLRPLPHQLGGAPRRRSAAPAGHRVSPRRHPRQRGRRHPHRHHRLHLPGGRARRGVLRPGGEEARRSGPQESASTPSRLTAALLTRQRPRRRPGPSPGPRRRRRRRPSAARSGKSAPPCAPPRAAMRRRARPRGPPPPRPPRPSRPPGTRRPSAGPAGPSDPAAVTRPVQFPDELPISARVREIAAAVDQHQVVIVAGETGSGKTTQLPKICLAMGRGLSAHIGVTQPRRIAATSVAARVAKELDVELGREVGYQIRFADSTSPATYVKFMTDGILLAEIQGDPLLRAYDTLILDEAHERNLNLDFLLGYVKRLLPKRRDLRVIVSSATLEIDRFAAFFGGAPVVQVSGRTYPVDVLYRPPDGADLAENVAAAVDDLTALDPREDVLVFLPGEREIHEAADALTARALPHTVILPLYGRLSQADQARVFQPLPQRRVVLATNVAETSLTIPGIVYVIDAGLARINRHNPRSGVTQLLVEPISRASADQRKGRAGRTQSGVCFRLYEEQDFALRPAYTDPEILRVGLAGAILQMKALGLGDIDGFPFLDPPPKRAVDEGYRVLEEIGALDGEGALTDIGKKLARLPVDPRIGRMILAGEQEGALREVLILAAALGVQDPRERPLAAQKQADDAHRRFRDEGSDFTGLLKLWHFFQDAHGKRTQNQVRKLCRDGFLNYLRMREWIDVHTQLSRIVRGHGHQAQRDARRGRGGAQGAAPRAAQPGGHVAPGAEGLPGRAADALPAPPLVEPGEEAARVGGRGGAGGDVAPLRAATPRASIPPGWRRRAARSASAATAIPTGPSARRR